MNRVPMVSVVMPAYNASAYIAEAIESVRKQSYKPLELVVVDDGSTDATPEIAARCGVRLLRQEHLGPAAARNMGVRESAGELIAFMDADDICAEERISAQARAFMEDTELDIAFGHAENFISPELDAPPAGEAAKPAAGHCIGAMMVRRTSFERAGFFSEDLLVADFLEWYGNAKHLGFRARVLDDVVIRRRIHGKNLGFTKKNLIAAEYAKVLSRAIQRRKKTS